LTKLHNNERPSVKAADLVNCDLLASLYTYERSCRAWKLRQVHTTHWPRAKRRLRNAEVSMRMLKKP